MSQITITENKNNTCNILYLKSGLEELFDRTGCVLDNNVLCERNNFCVNCPDYYADIVRAELLDKTAEIIAIKYKYDYFKKNIKIGGLCEVEKEILLASLIAADLEEDKKYVFDKIKGENMVAVDGTFNFRLLPLKKKWADVVSYMPSCFMTSQLNDFVSFLLENKRKKVLIDNGKVYDEHYRRLKRSELLEGDECKIIREVLLSNAREIEVNGALPKLDEKYLTDFFGDKISFSSKYFD